VAANARTVVDQALQDAGVALGDIELLVHANVARPLAEAQFHQGLGIPAERTTYEWGRDIGHVGGADQLLGLDHLVESGRLEPRQRVLLIGAGMGFTWTAAVVEMNGPAAPQAGGRRKWFRR